MEVRHHESHYPKVALTHVPFPAGQLRLAYNSVLLLMRLPFFCDGKHAHLATEVLNASREVMYIVQALDIPSLITVGWTLMGEYFHLTRQEAFI